MDNVSEQMLNWYKSQVKETKLKASRAKISGNSRMAHYYTQEFLNYQQRVQDVETN